MVGKPLAFDEVYKTVKRAILGGMFLPGHRIDSGRLQSLVRMSNTPVREALRCLSAEGLVEAHPREGFYIPYMSETSLSSLYDWLHSVTLFAVRAGIPTHAATQKAIDFDALQEMPVEEATAIFFLAVAIASGSIEAEAAMRRSNDRLFLIRTLEEGLLADRAEELADLVGAWREAAYDAFEALLANYVSRRQAIVPTLVRLVHRPAL